MDRHPVQPPQLEGGTGRERVPAGGAHQGVPVSHQEAGESVQPCEPGHLQGECGAWAVAVDGGEKVYKLHWSSHESHILQRSVSSINCLKGLCTKNIDLAKMMPFPASDLVAIWKN